MDVLNPSDLYVLHSATYRKFITLRFSMGDIINISRVDQAVCWPEFTDPYSTKPSAELSSRFRLTLSCCSTTSTVDEVQWYAQYAIKLVTARDVVVPLVQ